MVDEKWQNSTGTDIAHYKYVYDGKGNIVRSIDILSKKEYNYQYEEGRIVRATEANITLSGEIVTSKVVVNTVKYYYDTEGKMTKKVITPANGTEQTIYYETNDDNTVVKFSAGGKTVTSHSKTDSFGRKTFDELQLGTGFVSRQFHYHPGNVTDAHVANEKLKSSATTQLVSRIVLSGGRTLSYEYDAEERITKVTDSVDGTTEYTYDALGQLLTETKNGIMINTMAYDNYGNIVKKNGKAYTYGNAVWKDLLTGFDGKTITYDAQGNPISYLGHTLTWEKGRQLKSFDSNTYTYNANGIRTSKTVNGVLHTYTLDGTKILKEVWLNNTIVPLYDNEDSVCGILYNNIPYYFIKNLQGDVIAIVDKDAQTVARYSYDAWGVPEIKLDSSDCEIATINPFRYRGYYYDEEIELYYLQSRYYDASVGRFIKSDIPEMMLLQVEKASGTNLFAYCNNDAIGGSDPMGILDAAGVARWLSASSVFALFAESLYTAFTATMTKIGLYITSILTPKAAAAFWWQPWVVVGIVVAAVAIVLAAVSVARSKAQSKADENVRKKVSNKKHTFYEAYFSSGIVTVGAGITQAKAVARLKSGQHVFTMFGYNAKMICSLAGSAVPMWHAKEQNAPNYYNHYHVSKHINSAHCWYLI